MKKKLIIHPFANCGMLEIGEENATFFYSDDDLCDLDAFHEVRVNDVPYRIQLNYSIADGLTSVILDQYSIEVKHQVRIQW
jgi:hypothetical protein